MARGKKTNIMKTVTDLGVAGAGGFAGGKATTLLEQQLLKLAPKFLVAAPTVVAILSEIGANAVKPGTMISTALHGSAIVNATEVIEDVVNMVMTPKNGGGNGGNGGNGTTTEENGEAIAQGLRMRSSATNPVRMNGGYLMFN